MKKKLFGGFLIIALAIVASANININANKANNHVRNFTMSNVEALGMCEVFNESGALLLKCDGVSTCVRKINTGSQLVFIRCEGTLVVS